MRENIPAPRTPWPPRLAREALGEKDSSWGAVLLPNRSGWLTGACVGGICTAKGWVAEAVVPACGGGWFEGRVV